MVMHFKCLFAASIHFHDGVNDLNVSYCFFLYGDAKLVRDCYQKMSVKLILVSPRRGRIFTT